MRICCVASVLVLLAALGRADINRWDNGEVIPGTEGITPGPGVDLHNWNTGPHNLRYADFRGNWGTGMWTDLSDARFEFSNLTNAIFYASTLTNTNLTGANLNAADLSFATLTNANFTGALVTGAHFVKALDFTASQLYSTQSYAAKDLHGIWLAGNDLSGWDFHEQNLTNASFYIARIGFFDSVGSNLTNANLTGANLTNARLRYSTLSDADLTGANLRSADLVNSMLTNANLESSDLTNANLNTSSLTSANLTGADTRGALSLYLAGTNSHNAILPDGNIAGLDLSIGDKLLVRDEDGVPDPAPQYWLNPRDPIHLTIQNHMNMSDGGVLELLFDADPWDSLISFKPDIPVQLGGTLELTFADDTALASQVGRTLHIFDWTGVSPTGQFQVASPYAWDLTQLYTTGNVTLLSVLIGDMNGDGNVDALDAGIMFGNWGGSGEGDLNIDGIVDAADAGQLFAA